MKRSMFYLQYTNPANYPPLEHSGLILLEAGWDVRYFGIQSEGASSKLTFPEALAGHVRLWQRSPPGMKQKLHFAAFIFAALWRALLQRPTWVYCSDTMSCPAALLIGRLTRCKVLYHEHDSPDTGEKLIAETLKTEILKKQNRERKAESGKQTPKKNGAFQRFLLWTRKRVGRKADLVVLPNEKRLEKFVQTTGRKKRSLCVFNCPRREEVREAKAEIGMLEIAVSSQGSSGKLRLVFVGSINRDRLPLAVLEAMRRFPGRVHLTVIGYETVGSKNYVAEFLQRANSLDLQADVEFLGALPRFDIFAPISNCMVGLAFMPLLGGDMNMANMTGASNKPFDYLACGLALLVSDLPDWKTMFVEPGYGLACNPDDADSITAQLRWFLEHPAETRQMGKGGRQRILEKWNYERQFASVMTVLETTV
jgi:glycosyltransferase involved in cell wall biosynthesis